MTLRDDLLPVFDSVRALMADLDFRRYDIVRRVTTWSGERIGDGSPTETDLPLTLDASGRRIKVKRLTSHEVVSSGGKYAAGDFRIGPLTPTFDGGGVDPSLFNPAVGTAPQEVSFQLTGPGMEDGAWFKLIDTETEKNFGYYFVLRRTAVDQ